MCKECVYYKEIIDVTEGVTERMCMKYNEQTYPTWESCKHLKRKDDNTVTEVTDKVYNEVIAELRW